MTLEKAKLFEILSWPSNGSPQVSPTPQAEVQFNPASLKISYSNQVQTDGNNTSSAIQSVGKGDSKLSVELLFDVSGVGATDRHDVRQMTKKVAYFMETKPDTAQTSGEGDKKEQRYKVLGLRFQWGSFYFDGILLSMDETLDYWSEEGHPLRATLSLSMSQPGIHYPVTTNPQATPSPTKATPTGTIPLTPSLGGATLQGMVARAGINADWKVVAAVNGIENPRNLAAGRLLNFNVGAQVSANASINF
jgi:hypothetical protein